MLEVAFSTCTHLTAIKWRRMSSLRSVPLNRLTFSVKGSSKSVQSRLNISCPPMQSVPIFLVLLHLTLS